MKKRPGKDKPVMQSDLKAVVADIKQELKKYATKEELQQVRNEMKEYKEEIIHAVQVGFENVHADLAGAFRDEFSAIKDKQQQHEERITVLENMNNK